MANTRTAIDDRRSRIRRSLTCDVGNIAIPSRFSLVSEFSEGLAAAREKPWRNEEGKWVQGDYGYIDKQGNWVVRPQFIWANEFVGGRAAVGSPREG